MFALHFHTSDIFKSVCMIAQNGAAFPSLVGCVCGGVMVEVVGERGGSRGVQQKWLVFISLGFQCQRTH